MLVCDLMCNIEDEKEECMKIEGLCLCEGEL